MCADTRELKWTVLTRPDQRSLLKIIATFDGNMLTISKLIVKDIWLTFWWARCFIRIMLLMTIDVRNNYVYLIFIWTLSVYRAV